MSPRYPRTRSGRPSPRSGCRLRGHGLAATRRAHRRLRHEHAAEGHHHRGEVHRAERLREQQHPERRADHGVDQADDGDGTGIHPGQSAEPQHVAQGRPDEAEVGQGQHGRQVERGRGALGHGGDGHEQQATGDQLPRRRDEHVVGRRPALDQREAQCGRQHGPDGGGHPHGVDGAGPVVLPDQRDDPGDPDHGGEQGDPRLPLPDDEEGRAHDDEGRQRGDRRPEPARQAEGRHVEQAEEQAVVEGTQHHRPAPPAAPRKTSHPQQQQQPRGQHPGGGGEERPVSGEPQLGDRVGRAPDDRRARR